MSSDAALLHERRRFVRFRARYEAEVRTDGVWHATRTRDLSQGGVSLSPPPPPVIPRSIGLRLYVPTKDKPIELEGAVRHLDVRVAHVQFEGGGDLAAACVRELAELEVVPELELHIGDTANDCHDLVTLAGWYRELGRNEHALQLYRSARGIDRPGRIFYEHMALFLLEEAGSGTSDPEPILEELAGVICEGRQLGYSATLEAVAAEANEWHHQLSPQRYIGPPPPASATARAEIERLRHSIRAHREDLYVGFSRLLDERRRLALLEQRRGVLELANDPEASSTEGLLESIEAQLHKLRDSSHPDDMPAMQPSLPRSARSFPHWPLALSAALGLGIMVFWIFRAAQVSTAPPVDAVTRIGPPAAAVETPTQVQSALAQQPANDPVRGAAPAEQAQRSPPPNRVGSATAASLAGAATPPKTHRTGAASHDTAAELPAPAMPPTPAWLQPQAARQLSPADLAYRSGTQLLRQRKVLLAISALERAVRHDPEYAHAYRALGVAYSALGRERAAVQAFTTFLRLDPEHHDAAKVRAIVDAAAATTPP